MTKEEILEYFYCETEGIVATEVVLVETKSSYLWQMDCYKISTEQGTCFYVFDSDMLPVNIYPIREGETLDECYYKHIGFMTELCSSSIDNNFIFNFIEDYSIFPILDRRINEIEKDITLDKNANQFSGIANQIRDCYLNLTDYLMNRMRTNNPEFKNDNFTSNLEEFLKLIIPGKQSETRRNTINGIAQKGWKFNSELVHKDSITVFDILISINILRLLVSTVSNLIVGNNMPFNKVKCPHCHSEKYTMEQNSMFY
ncbi:MAG: hypothetical protein IKJ73_10960 [Lachnospiraceae bacterium]|nr:hypothetical protein [Lachnospiraceae bacterium]